MIKKQHSPAVSVVVAVMVPVAIAVIPGILASLYTANRMSKAASTPDRSPTLTYITAGSASVLPTESTSVVSESGVKTDTPSISEEIALESGAIWKTLLNSASFFEENHDSLQVIVSNVSGSSYTMWIAESDGTTFDSKEYSGDTTTIITPGTIEDAYTVTILNSGTGTLNAHIDIRSYRVSLSSASGE